jgi:hypothetical protein
MAQVVAHLSVDDLERGFRSARDLTAARHFQVIWLLARGRTIADVAAVTSFVPRWIEPLLARTQCARSRCTGRPAAGERNARQRASP